MLPSNFNTNNWFYHLGWTVYQLASIPGQSEPDSHGSVHTLTVLTSEPSHKPSL